MLTEIADAAGAGTKSGDSFEKAKDTLNHMMEQTVEELDTAMLNCKQTDMIIAQQLDVNSNGVLYPAHFVRTSKKDKIKAQSMKELLKDRDLLEKAGTLPKAPDSILTQIEKEKGLVIMFNKFY